MVAAGGMGEVYEAGVIHRDFKNANLMVAIGKADLKAVAAAAPSSPARPAKPRAEPIDEEAEAVFWRVRQRRCGTAMVLSSPPTLARRAENTIRRKAPGTWGEDGRGLLTPGARRGPR